MATQFTNDMKTKITSSIKLLSLACALFLAGACEDEPTVQRSKVLQVYGGEEVYVGDTQEYTIPSYSTRETFSWTVSGTGASVPNGTGEYLYVAFNQPGSFSIKVTKPDGSEGTLDVEAISKTLALDGDTSVVTESIAPTIAEIPLIIDNKAVGRTVISYSLSGTAVEGVDYELLTANPLVLTAADAKDSLYVIRVLLLPDSEPETETKYIVTTLTSVTTEIESEIVLTNEADLLVKTLEIEDDIRVAGIEGTDEEDEIKQPQVVSVTLTLSGESTEDVTVSYSITGVGVNDVTATGVGSVTFTAGEVSKTVSLQFTPAAFAAEQTVSLEIVGVTSADTEVVPGEDIKIFNVKKP